MINKVVIAGGGTAGWVAATALSRKLGELVDITLVESDSIGTVGVGEATIPPMRKFHQLMRIDEQEFMRETQATFKLGIEFENWRTQGHKYIHSFGRTGKSSWMADFHHFWLRGLERGIETEIGDFCYEFKAAKAGRFGFSPQADINYAYHLDATAYAKYLRRLCEKSGVVRVEGKIQQVNQNPDSGYIESLTLEGGQTVEGDLFVDCTGFRALLIEQTLRTGFEDWSRWLPCDSAVAVQSKSQTDPVPYTRSIAYKSGWRWQIPLQSRTGNGLVFCSRYMDDDDAAALLLDEIEGEAIADPRLIKFQTGRRRKAWNKNCVALGLSSGFIEPLESTSIHLVVIGVTRLLQLFPFNGISESVVNYYNNLTNADLENIRDFLVLHYHATERTDSDFWRYCRNMDVPDELRLRMSMFKEEGQLIHRDGELFTIDSWSQVMLGQGVTPEAYHPLARLMSDEELGQLLNGMRATIESAVSRLPSHQEFIRQYCAARSS